MYFVHLNGKNGSYRFTPEEKSSVLRSNGKFSVIYKGENTSGASPVIIKMLHPRWNTSNEERKRFVSEYVNSIQTDFTPQVLDICELGSNLYIIREYIEGEVLSSYSENKSIREWIKKSGREKVSLKILDVFIQLHNKNVIHGDIKPSNIVFSIRDNDLKIYIIDLGLAVPLHHTLNRNADKPIPFALMYAAPELMLNFPDLIHPATDIYSLALTIYEFLTGEKPFEVNNPAVLMSVQLNQALEYHSKINLETLKVLNQAAFKFHFQKPIQNYTSAYIRKSLNAAIICRYQKMEDFKEALQKAFVAKRKFWV